MPEEEDVREDEPGSHLSVEPVDRISLDQAGRMAMDAARDNPGDYGRRFARMPMAFQPLEQREADGQYFITLSLRPESGFQGEPGQEQFVMEKDGAITGRRVLRLPQVASRRPRLLLSFAIGLAVLVAVALVWGAFAAGLFGGNGQEQPPTATLEASGTELADGSQPTLDLIALGLIAFASDRDGNPEIYLMDASGSGLTRLTNHQAADTLPSWSPDGNRIVFTSDREGNNEVFVMDADGTDQIDLTRDPGQDSDPVWSPDGMRITFTSERETGFEVFVMDFSGLEQDRLSNNNGRRNTTAAWSPDGSKIAFTSYQDDLNISVMKSNGADEIILTTDPGDDASPAWSPDGTRMAFNSWRDGNAEIYVMNADGTGQTRLTFDSADDLGPSWSRDGAKIAFESERDGQREIYMINPDGTSLTRITDGGGYSPAWSPVPAPGKLTLYLVPSESNPQSLSLSDAGLGKVSVVKIPLEYDVPEGIFENLEQLLWTESSLIFSGTGVSGSWLTSEGARLVLQLNGPMTDANYSRCIALRINGKETSSSCGTTFDSQEFVTGGYTVAVGLPSPLLLDSAEKLEVSIVLGTASPAGEKVVPNLVFGGDILLQTSFLEIGIDPE